MSDQLWGKNQDLNPQTLPHNFRFMGGIFKEKMNRNLIETREAKYGGSDPDSYPTNCKTFLCEIINGNFKINNFLKQNERWWIMFELDTYGLYL